MSGLQKGDVAGMIRAHLRSGQTGVDIGADDGYLSTVMRACVGPAGYVVAFEPRLREDAEIHGATLVRAAVGAAAGHAVLYLGKPANTASLWSGAVKRRATGKPSIAVPVVRLDDVVFYADLVKVDVQGGEMAVLEGAPRLLATCQAWILECWPWGLEQAGASAVALYDRVVAAGLMVAGVSREDLIAWVAKADETSHVNWLCVR